MLEREIISLTNIDPAVYLALFNFVLGMAFTRDQVLAIRERDKNKCQFPGPHNCSGRLEVHHVLPQRYCSELNIDPDFAENGITVCESAHQGEIHPDMRKAKKEYWRDKKAFKKAFSLRDELLGSREIYWDPSHDRQMSAVAVRNTQRARKEGWELPPKGEKVIYRAKK